MKYKIVLTHSEEGYSASCPGLPGCWSQGQTEDEAVGNIREAIEDYMMAISDTVKGKNIRSEKDVRNLFC